MKPHQLAAVLNVEGWVSEAEAGHLFELARAVSYGCIVEVGSFRGRSTAALGLGSQAGADAPVYAIEPHESFVGVYGGRFGAADRAAFFRAMLELELTRTVRLVNLSSEVVSPAWPHPVALLWVDGDHRYEAVRRDWDAWSPHLLPDAKVVFDDALDPDIGPSRLISALQEEGWTCRATVGKTATLARK